ncbi:MAG: CRISPR-associated CARF protein Csa3 [Methanobacteriaceae archaeon]|jgi:CRISPR-associated protein Csa3|nr:CRISPR-associated CARF protein Csa3 [Methanobacteriaceae archaeon]MDO9044529.1 CRISPR-associated CARF protein Csa3 [Methanobacteriaceae archaeon]MDO9626127.1 CRISPR-associated CARF protein Csa3 [Methanobacteriaceae archaeon]MDP2835728.1 CRISPR-associated CARF protein Csa3 [Methanobacteriaceae archaeon]MDP3035852.1 CRISPR-associated CARF protein Csa3 [Methanobacteriaceae archaeon]
MDTTLISTIYSIEPVMICITQFSPKKVILLREDDAPDEKTKVEQILNDTVGKFIEIVPKETSLYNVVKVAEDTTSVIEDEKANGRRVVVNISGGRKPQALGALFGCYARHHDVERIVYVTEEDSELIDLPILNFGISKTKKEVLEELQKGETSVKNLAVKIGISRGMTYNHIRELREMGFIARNKLEITSAGELAVI